jgi:hypothetical protein
MFLDVENSGKHYKKKISPKGPSVQKLCRFKWVKILNFFRAAKKIFFLRHFRSPILVLFDRAESELQKYIWFVGVWTNGWGVKPV